MRSWLLFAALNLLAFSALAMVPDQAPCRYTITPVPGEDPALPGHDGPSRSIKTPLTRHFVKTGADHRPRVYVVSSAGDSSLLLPDVACCPSESPDGLSVACLVWEPQTRVSELFVVEVATRRVRALLPRFTTLDFAWSPDSRFIAGYAKCDTCRSPFLFWASVAEGEVRRVDSLEVLGDYDFRWKPDGVALVVCRPTAVEELSERTCGSELLLVSDRGRAVCRVPVPESVALTSPHWVSDSLLTIRAEACGGVSPGGPNKIIYRVRLRSEYPSRRK